MRVRLCNKRVPAEHKRFDVFASGRNVDRVEVTRLVDHARVQRDAPDLPTAELVSIIVSATLTRADQEAIAMAIDGAKSSRATRVPNELRGVTELAGTASDFLAALSELSRRAALAPPPTKICRPADVALIAQRELGGRRRECVLVIACDCANRVLRTEIASRGSADRAPVPVREILSTVFRCDGRAFAVAHNHPEGLLDSSDHDESATGRLAAAAHTVGLRFLGHVVVAGDAWMALSTQGPRILGSAGTEREPPPARQI